MILADIFDINQDVIKVHNDKNINFFCSDFVDIALKAGGNIEKIKKHNLVLKMAIPKPESYFLLIILLNSYSIICVY